MRLGKAISTGILQMKRPYLLLCLLLLVGCATITDKKLHLYIEPLLQASQEEVAHRVGPPQSARVLDDGKSVWVYVSKTANPKSCQLYSLTFDHKGLLKNWVREDC